MHGPHWAKYTIFTQFSQEFRYLDLNELLHLPNAISEKQQKHAMYLAFAKST